MRLGYNYSIMSARDPFIGRLLAGCRLERLLGRGGMATVYYGWDLKLERPVAVKVIDAQRQHEATYAVRFVNEARMIAALSHPHVLQVYSAGDEDDLFFFVMEYVRGSDVGVLLETLRREGRRMPAADVVRIGRAVAEALDYAHAHGIIHRDVKPTNVLVAEEGRIVLADFGLAMEVAQGTLGTAFGSPHYIAPEQARSSAEVVPQSDLYSLGVMLYEMLVGSVPFNDSSPAALALQHLTQAPPEPRSINPALNPETEAVLLKALQKAPADRFQTGQALIAALENALESPHPTEPFLNLKPKPAKRERSDPTPALSLIPGAAGAGAGLAPGRPWSSPALRRLLRQPSTWWGVGCLGAFFVVALLGSAGLNFLASEANGTGQRNAGANVTAAASEAAQATSIPAEDAAATSGAVTSAPTAGDRFALYYDNTGFYFHNLSGKDRPIHPVAFERLDAAGNPVNRFDGWRWGEIYGTFRADRCMVVALIDYTSHLDPAECRNKHLVYRTPFASDGFIFWTEKEGSQQFRVLWQETEVGRCDIAAHNCEVYLP